MAGKFQIFFTIFFSPNWIDWHIVTIKNQNLLKWNTLMCTHACFDKLDIHTLIYMRYNKCINMLRSRNTHSHWYANASASNPKLQQGQAHNEEPWRTVWYCKTPHRKCIVGRKERKVGGTRDFHALLLEFWASCQTPRVLSLLNDPTDPTAARIAVSFPSACGSYIGYP